MYFELEPGVCVHGHSDISRCTLCTKTLWGCSKSETEPQLPRYALWLYGKRGYQGKMDLETLQQAYALDQSHQQANPEVKERLSKLYDTQLKEWIW